MVLRHGIEPHPLVLQTSVRTSYTNEANMEDWVGLEPTMLYSGLKVRAVRHYGNQSFSVAMRLCNYGLYVIHNINIGSG